MLLAVQVASCQPGKIKRNNVYDWYMRQANHVDRSLLVDRSNA